MALGLYRCQITLNKDTGIAADACMNTWHFKGTAAGSATSVDASAIVTQLAAFYQAVDTVILSPLLTTLADYAVYDLSQAMPRVPISTGSFALVPATQPAYPDEVAICLSYQAAPVSGLPQARRRGRIYLGPISNNAGETAADRVLINNVAIASVSGAAANLATNSGTANVPWVVYSPTSAAFDGDVSAASVVTDGWVDNAFDTIRSRGAAATVRNTWT